MSNYLPPHGLQHARIPCPSPPILLKIMFIESVMPSNHLFLCCPLLLLPSVFPTITVSFSELALPIRWPKHRSFSFSISPSNEYSGFLFPLGSTGLTSLQAKGLSKVFSNTTVQKYQFFSAQLSLWSNSHTSIHDYQKNHSFESPDICHQSSVSAF